MDTSGNSKMSKLLALDQSSQLSGYAVFDEDGTLVSSGKITTEGEPIDRIISLTEKVDKIIEEFGIEEVVIEDIYYSGNVETFKILSFTMAGLLFLFTEKEIPYSILNATIWKSQCGVKGKDRPEQKRNAQKFVENEYGLKVIQDIADAVCIGTGHIRKKYHKDAKKNDKCQSNEKDLLFFD